MNPSLLLLPILNVPPGIKTIPFNKRESSLDNIFTLDTSDLWFLDLTVVSQEIRITNKNFNKIIVLIFILGYNPCLIFFEYKKLIKFLYYFSN
jgi:hypothetical protein